MLGIVRAILALAVSLAVVSTAAAQAPLPKTIKIVVPFSAGGSNDVIARAIAQPLSAKLGVPVVGLRTWRLRQPEGRRVPLVVAASPEDAVARAVRAASRNARRARKWLA